MSALAKLVADLGYKVAGSDRTKSDITKQLKESGIKVFYSHKSSNIKGQDLIVYSGAIGQDNAELLSAKKNCIDIMERSTFLGKLSKSYKQVIAIAGTHGKTTTTAMIGYAFILAGLNPTIHLGGQSNLLGGNLYKGSNNFFITEACEFRDSFLTLSPNISVITNIEREHLDYFKSFEREIMSFNKFAKKTKEAVFVNFDNKDYFREELNVMFFNSYFMAKNLSIWQDGKYEFDLYINKKFIEHIKLNICGKYNVSNALAMISVCRFYDISWQVIKLALLTFENVERRFEYLGEFGSNVVVSDYAHHPTEIANAIKTCQEKYNKQPVCVFQPHTYSRTKLLINEFVDVFLHVSKLLIVKTYSAREKYEYLGSAEHLCDKLKSKKKYSMLQVCNKEEILPLLQKSNLQNSVILFLGAGDINLVANEVVKKSILNH